MKPKKLKIQQADLHAYIDDQLSEERALEVEAFLEKNPRIAERVNKWKQQNNSIAEYFDDDRFNRIPSRLDPVRIKRKTRSAYFSISASVLLMLASGLLGWFSHSFVQQAQRQSFEFARPAIAAHQVFVADVRHPVEVGVNEKDHLEKWLSKRLDYWVIMPKLQKIGYKLLGGRLLSVTDGPAAQLMFENAEGNRITCFISRNPSSKETAFQFKKINDVNTFYWFDQDIAYAVIGDIDRDELLSITHEIYQQVNEAFQKAKEPDVLI